MSKPAEAKAGSVFRVPCSAKALGGVESGFGTVATEAAVVALEEAADGVEAFGASGGMGSPRISGGGAVAASLPQPTSASSPVNARPTAIALRFAIFISTPKYLKQILFCAVLDIRLKRQFHIQAGLWQRSFKTTFEAQHQDELK